jgi:hypothetical protein
MTGYDYKQPSNVSGKSIQDIMNLTPQEVNSLGLADLRRVVGRVVSAANKRARRFLSKGETSPAVEKLNRSGGLLSTKGKNVNQLRRELMRGKEFLQSGASTRRGWNKIKKETVEGLRKQGVDINTKQFEKFWKTFENLKERSPEVANKALRYNAMKDVANAIKDSQGTPEEIAARVQGQLEAAYQQNMEATNASGVSSLLEFK